MDFEKLNKVLYTKAGHYKFAKKPTDFDRGYMKISDWINDLCWHYVSKRKALDAEMDREFKEIVRVQKEKVSALETSEYKNGLLKAIEDIA